MRRIYYGNKPIIIVSSIFWFAINILVCVPFFLMEDLFSRRMIISLIGLTLLWVCVLILRLNLVLVIDEDQIRLIRAFLSGKPVYLWKEMASIHYYPKINSLLLRTERKHNVWINPIVKNYKIACHDAIEQALKSNPSIAIRPKTLENLRKNGIL